MPDSKITALTALTAADPANDMMPIVDVSDTSMAASGTTKRISINNILACSPTATLASATISGDLTVDTNTLKVDSANNRVGIGTASPAAALDVFGGNIRLVGGNIFQILNSSNDSNVDISSNGGAGVASMLFKVAGSSAMTLNSTGLGVGVAPSAWATYKAVSVGGIGASVFGLGSSQAGVAQGAFFNNGAGSGWAYSATSQVPAYYLQINGEHRFHNAVSGTAGNQITAWTQAMTLDASGNLLVGTTTANFTNTNGFVVSQTADATYASVGHSTGTATGAYYCSFGYNGTQIGSITQNGTTGVLYNINSDYRLKESIAPLSGGLARINALKPSIYKWKSDGSAGEGFLAHELAEVVPFAVTGEKDAVNEDGTIKTQGIDMSRIVPILVAAIQELTARVQTLEAK